MHPLVFCAVAALCERLVAVVTFEWFLSSMLPLVYCAGAAGCERLVAVVAFEWFLSSMQRHVAHLVLLLFDHCIIDKNSMPDCRNCLGVDSVASQVP